MHTRATLARDLRALGVPAGGVLVLHSGYRALGPVEGGPAAVVGALLDAVGPEGTLMAPTFTANLTDPYVWVSRPTPEERERLVAEMPEFDPATSPPDKMGAVATALWRTPGTLRSRHPVTSWCAHGPLAERLLAVHPLDDPEGEDGPVGRAWASDARILLLGVGHDANTTLHLAECRLDLPHLYALPDRFPTRDAEGRRVLRPVAKTTKCSDGFVKIAPWLRPDREGRVGDAQAMVFRSREVVRVATEVLRRDPTALLCDDPDCVHCPTSHRVLGASWPTS